MEDLQPISNAEQADFCVELAKRLNMLRRQDHLCDVTLVTKACTETRNSGTPERRNAGTPERRNTETRNTETRNTKLLKPGTYEK